MIKTIKKTVFAFLLCAVAVAATPQERVKPVYKVSRLSVTTVSIACTNGANPSGSRYGDTLIISCAK